MAEDDVTPPADYVGEVDTADPCDVLAEHDLLLAAERVARSGSWSMDLATSTVQVSPGLRELARLIPPVTAADLLDLVHPEDRAGLSRLVAAVRSGTVDLPAQLEVRGAGRRALDTYLVRATARRVAGKVVAVHGTAQAMSAPGAIGSLQQRLSQDSRLFGDAQRSVRMGTWEWNTATNDVNWSTTLYELIGISAETPVDYYTYLAVVHPDDRSWVDELWRSLARSGRPVECEHRVVRPDGDVRVIRCRGEALGPEPDSQTMIGTAQDVTELRSTETRMQRSSQRFTDLVAIMPVGIGLFEDSGRLVDANDALCRLLGLPLARLRGQTLDAVLHPEDGLGRQLTKAEHGTNGQAPAPPFEIGARVLRGASGRPVYCELSATVSVADDGRRFWLVVVADVTDRRRTADRLRYQATHDELTGLPGRAAVKELLAHLLKGENAERIGLLFCDVDNFKRVNDSLGHDVGDELITALARRLERGMPPSCTVARMSGDEYVVICPDVAEVGGVEALASLAASLLRTAVPVRGELVRVSASIGAAVPAGAETSGADLLRFADAAMFDAKRRGTGRVAMASDKLIASANSQVRLEGQLREAIATDQLVLHYQPVAAADGTVLSAEALVRWPHPERGMLTPGDFLPVAEQGDLLGELDRWVLRTALCEAASWPLVTGSTLGGSVGVAVNLAGLVPGDPDFVDVVSAAVLGAGLAWDRVVLELVETSLIDLPERSTRAMNELVERGVRFAVDDFGTGYSSLARLKELPAQIIKIDRMFVSGVATDVSDFAVARAVVDMARAMRRTCVAEGVETATQFHVLRGIGVEAYQGWLLARPMPAPEFRELLKRGNLPVPRAT